MTEKLQSQIKCPDCHKWFAPKWRTTLFDRIVITTCPRCGEKYAKRMPEPEEVTSGKAD